MKLIGGVEGGATKSVMVIINSNGQLLARSEGPSTNHLYMNDEKFFSITKALVEQTKLLAMLPINEPLDAIGLCLSGCHGDLSRELTAQLSRKYPHISREYIFANDCIGTMYSAPFKNGIALISGTGSNSVLFNEKGPVITCGGWGHLFDDEGSGYFIAKRAYKAVLDKHDNMVQTNYDLIGLERIVCEYIGVTSIEDCIDFFYSPFDKKKFAGLCKPLALELEKHKNEYIEQIFYEAGQKLACMVVALANRRENPSNSLNIVCTGSVFESWKFLSKGFSDGLYKGNATIKTNFKINKENITMHKCIETSAFGAAKFAAINLLNLKDINLKMNLTQELIL